MGLARSWCLAMIGISVAGPLVAQGPPAPAAADPPVITVCDALRAGSFYDGRMVRIRGRIDGTTEGTWLVGDDCPGVLVTDQHLWPSWVWLAQPGWPLVLHPIDFKFDKLSGLHFRRAYRRLAKRTPDRCILSTVTGLFETRTDWLGQKLTYRNGASKYAGFGHLGEAPAQLILRSEDSVEVIPGCAAREK